MTIQFSEFLSILMCRFLGDRQVFVIMSGVNSLFGVKRWPDGWPQKPPYLWFLVGSGTELDSLCPRNDHLVPRSIGLGISVGQILLIIQWLLFWADIDFAFIFLQAPLQGILLWLKQASIYSNHNVATIWNFSSAISCPCYMLGLFDVLWKLIFLFWNV